MQIYQHFVLTLFKIIIYAMKLIKGTQNKISYVYSQYLF